MDEIEVAIRKRDAMFRNLDMVTQAIRHQRPVGDRRLLIQILDSERARIAALEADLDTQTAMTVRALADRDANIAAWERVLGRRSEGEAQAYVRGLESALAEVMETICSECDCIYSDESNPMQCPCKTARAVLASHSSGGSEHV